ncbi:hypothetical protein BJ878DRAFT_73911 [Calycina marina]|uniref:RGS domain-containing protein n=1 Tax=Calycina marina TaxID=1763456 RepID=A0A9P8CGD7_9HELO|nr:hypothetical protein BJ878DRAFT_73911 [Calycina marina]
MSSSIDQVLDQKSRLEKSRHFTQANDSTSSINRTPPLVQTQNGRPTSLGGPRPVRSMSLTHSRNDVRERNETLDGGSEASVHGSAGSYQSGIMDFFSSNIFQLVIHNPTTAYRFLRFCQSRNCGEAMEFLQKTDAYNRLLDDVAQSLTSIHKTYTAPDAPRQINISSHLIRRVSADVKHTTQLTLPVLEGMFTGAQEHVERLLASDVYPRFVRHQITASATMALSDHRERFQGLGDCFCLTDPSIADNPIVFASDGFVAVTGYSRREIVPRNCRFLQGDMTDSGATKRLRKSINNYEETVELLLNYRKNGEPFWNLLYCAPLFNERGEVSFFVGGQINCSTTIHSRGDILKVLSASDDEIESMDDMKRHRPASVKSQYSTTQKTKSSFFKSFRKYSPASSSSVRGVNTSIEAGMEKGLVSALGKLNFGTQIEAFYTAYSKYLVLSYNPKASELLIKHYSVGVIDILGLNLPNGGIAPIFHKDIFKILGEHSPQSSSQAKSFKETVRGAIRSGKAVSVELGMMTGSEERKAPTGIGRLVSSDRLGGLVRVEEKYICHWTPLKDEEGFPHWVVLTIAPKSSP